MKQKHVKIGSWTNEWRFFNAWEKINQEWRFQWDLELECWSLTLIRAGFLRPASQLIYSIIIFETFTFMNKKKMLSCEKWIKKHPQIALIFTDTNTWLEMYYPRMIHILPSIKNCNYTLWESNFVVVPNSLFTVHSFVLWV